MVVNKSFESLTKSLNIKRTTNENDFGDEVKNTLDSRKKHLFLLNSESYYLLCPIKKYG